MRSSASDSSGPPISKMFPALALLGVIVWYIASSIVSAVRVLLHLPTYLIETYFRHKVPKKSRYVNGKSRSSSPSSNSHDSPDDSRSRASSDVHEAIEVLQTLKQRTNSHNDLKDLERASQLLTRSASARDISFLDFSSRPVSPNSIVSSSNGNSNSHLSDEEEDDDDDESVKSPTSPSKLTRDYSSFNNEKIPSSHQWFAEQFPDLYWAWSEFSASWKIPDAPTQKAIRNDVFQSSAIREAINTSAKVNGKTVAQIKAAAYKMFDEMAASFDMKACRLGALVLRKVWRLLYPFGMNVDENQINMLREIHRSGGTLVYLPNHKSYLDFLILSYLCFQHGLPMPHVVAGINLNIPLIGGFLRRGGAFFIRRVFGSRSDPLYRTIFSEYVTTLLRRGFAVECFIEGGRSRSGKVLPPKPGFLRVVVDAVMDGRAPNVYVVPIALSYDRIVENDSFIRELTGGAKKAEALFVFIKSSLSILTSTVARTVHFGEINVGIAQPIRVSNYLEQLQIDKELQFKHEESEELRKVFTKYLGYRVLYECNKSSTILPAALVGTTLLTHYGRGITNNELIEKVKWLQNEVSDRGGHVIRHEQDITDTINSVVEMVLEGKFTGTRNRLVKRHKDILMLSLYSPAERMELSLYRNQLIQFFVSEGIVCCAFYALERDSQSAIFSVSETDLMKNADYLNQLFKYEFIYQPSPSMEDTFTKTLQFLVDRNIFERREDGTYVVNENPPVPMQGTYAYLFICSLFWPFVDSYWLCLLACYQLIPNKLQEEPSILRWAQGVGERLYFEGMLDLYEAISQETLMNALTLFEAWKIIEFVTVEGKITHNPGSRIVRLQEEYRNIEKFDEAVMKLSSFRKRITAYRSRRFKLRRNNYIIDAIEIAKKWKV